MDIYRWLATETKSYSPLQLVADIKKWKSTQYKSYKFNEIETNELYYIILSILKDVSYDLSHKKFTNIGDYINAHVGNIR